MAMKLTKGTSFPFDVGVFALEFCVLRDHDGNVDLKKWSKWVKTFSEPSVPGTRGIRIGASSPPDSMLRSSGVGRSRDLRESAESGEKAETSGRTIAARRR